MNEPVFIHRLAEVEPHVTIGAGSRVWAFAHVVNGAVIGSDCNVCDHTFIEGGVRIGNRVTIKCGVYLWTGVVLEDNVFVGPCVAFTNDLRPRSKQYPPEFSKTTLREGCSVGANATILPGINIGRFAMIAAGSVVTRDVPDHALVVGAPGRRKGWVCYCGLNLNFDGDHVAICACGARFREVPSANQITEIKYA